MKPFFTADLHLNHTNIIKHCSRPFKDVDSMNEHLIKCWNDTVPPGGLTYVLGDFAWGKGKGFGTNGLKEIIDRLNGQIILIEGSHDKPTIKLQHPKVVKIVPLLKIKVGKQDIVMCHYAMRTWQRSHYGAWHLYGHSHGRLPSFGLSLDVGVDTSNFYPYDFNAVKGIMKTLGGNNG
jgi:calcineurin-like phosphoesterase family protein